MVRSTPQITVLMSVYNDETYLAEAVESILSQTFSDFIFLIIDDASTDATSDILKRYAAQDNRIKIITNELNLGLTASLNKGLSHIDTPYIARMDSDDISLPERLEKQLAFMEGRPEIVALGCWIETIDAVGAPVEAFWAIYIRQYQDSTDIYKALFLGKSVLPHSSVMLRVAALKAIGGYRVCFRYAQDYDLWLRFLFVGKLAVLPEPLLGHRIHNQAISVAKLYEQCIANVSALSAALIRERGEADPLQNCTEALDYNRMVQLMDAAGAVAWMRWLEVSSYGETKLADKEISAISNKIIDLDWYDGTAEDQARHIRISDLWISKQQKYIEDLLEAKKYLENRTIGQEKYIEDLLAELDRFVATWSWRITAPLRKIAAVFQKK